MPAVNVLRARVVLRVVCEVNCGFVVKVKRRRVASFAELLKQGAQIYRFLGGFGRSYDLGFAGG
eukprot:979145-Pleurochrysis_carterae.AAC.1